MATTELNEKNTTVDPNIAIDDYQLGIWKLKIGATSAFNLQRQLNDVKEAYPLFSRLCLDIYKLAPRLFVLFILCQVWKGVEDAILMHLSSSLLRIIELGILSGKRDASRILSAIVLRVLCSVFAAYFSWHGEGTLATLRSRITCYFDLYLIKEVGIEQEVSATDAWHALEHIIYYLTELLTAFSQILLIANLSRTTGGTFFALLCVSKPIISAVFSRELWDKVCFGFIDNKEHRRLKALESLSSGAYRQDIISGNLSGWIVNEYEEAHRKIGDFADDHPYSSFSRRESPNFEILTKILGDLPMVYCGIMAILNPSRFSVASIAILQQSSMTLRYSLETILRSSEQFRRGVTSVRKVYQASHVINQLRDGNLPYPRVEEKEGLNGEKGMSFDLNNVSFAYPGSQKTTDALSNISLKIKAGQLVVIVGSNGSGKSTIVRILSRLYDPKSGKVLIDGRPSTDYSIEDLYHATTLLSQDNCIYPLSLAENIGLGYPDRSWDMKMIAEAADEGGALQFMEKLKNGMQTMLDPLIETFSLNLSNNKGHPLYEEMQQMEKKIEISGGERQRVVAARSFMRFKSGKVKFVAVDEPSSALDAEGELKLFNQLIGVRDGKTMVFVTHRFGHLTRHADQIVCMKDGSIVETGTHDELISRKGEYAKLYNIQASAFDQGSGSVSNSTPAPS